jgi:hypothetical protein
MDQAPVMSFACMVTVAASLFGFVVGVAITLVAAAVAAADIE